MSFSGPISAGLGESRRERYAKQIRTVAMWRRDSVPALLAAVDAMERRLGQTGHPEIRKARAAVIAFNRSLIPLEDMIETAYRKAVARGMLHAPPGLGLAPLVIAALIGGAALVVAGIIIGGFFTIWKWPGLMVSAQVAKNKANEQITESRKAVDAMIRAVESGQESSSSLGPIVNPPGGTAIGTPLMLIGVGLLAVAFVPKILGGRS